MIDPATTRIVQALIRLTSRSLLQYVIESFPWTPSSDSAVLTELQRLAQAEMAQVGQLSRFLLRQHQPSPHLSPYSESFTSYNYLAVSRLLGLLLQEQTRDISQVEQFLTKLPEGEARRLAQQLLAVKKENLAALTRLRQPQSVPA